jgi:hypothetical protein
MNNDETEAPKKKDNQIEKLKHLSHKHLLKIQKLNDAIQMLNLQNMLLHNTGKEQLV